MSLLCCCVRWWIMVMGGQALAEIEESALDLCTPHLAQILQVGQTDCQQSSQTQMMVLSV